MPGIGGRFGWNEPPPAAITTTLHSNVLPPSVVTRNAGSLHQRIDQALRRDFRDRRNVVDRLLRIKLGALAADLVEDVDEVALDVEQAEFEHAEQADGARSDNQHISLDRIAH
jgi:hypothetical protein